MPILPPALDDRSFDDLVEELLQRIPAHTPEWTHPRLGDPGRTLVDLFAWLADTILYRANLIPERQRLAFLRLVGLGMRPAVPARGLVSVLVDDDKVTGATTILPRATLKAAVPFETRAELTVFPVTAAAYVKRPLPEAEREELAALLDGLRVLYRLEGDDEAIPYRTTPVFPGGAMDAAGVDLARDAVDGSLWIALLAAKPEQVADARRALGTDGGAQRVLSVGVAPAVQVAPLLEDVGPRARVPLVWELSTGRAGEGEPAYVQLDVLDDGTRGLNRRGVVRLVLPGEDDIGAPADDVRANLDAGVDDAPPRLDAPEVAARVVAWVRMRAAVRMEALRLSWAGVNCVEVDARQTIRGRVLGEGDGNADQELSLGATSVEPETLELEVEDAAGRFEAWRRTDDLATAGRDDRVFQLDPEAGTVRFGDGVRGRVPERGRRVRAVRLRAGGGVGGNLPPGALAKIAARSVDGTTVPRLKVLQALPTEGGEDAETLAQAEARIPAVFRHRDRAVTADDFRRLAAETPGVRVGRVEVLPRFQPHQRRGDVPGAVSVLVLPHRDGVQAPAPRPDRPFREAVHAHLDARRPLTAELYVIGCEYVPLGVTTSVTIREGFAREETLNAVREAVRGHLWALAPGGAEGAGWPLGVPVRDRELEVVVARVAGVAQVAGVNLFQRRGAAWVSLRPRPDAPAELPLLPYQLPELLALVVTVDEPQAPPVIGGGRDPFGGGTGAGGSGGGPDDGGTGGAGGRRRGVAVPVVPEVC